MKPTYLQYFGFTSFCFTVFFTALLIATALFVTLLNIAYLSAEMKMCRIYTSGSVAIGIVKNILADRDGAAIKFPRNAMATFTGNTIPHIPIAILIQSSVPEPVSIAFQHIALEPFEQTLAWWTQKGFEYSATSMTASTAGMTKAIVVRRSAKGKMLQPNAPCVIAEMADAKAIGNRAIEIEPNPFRSVKVIPILSENGTPSVIGASSPMPAVANGRAGCGHRPVTINVLVESENGVYELGRHNDSFRFV